MNNRNEEEPSYPVPENEEERLNALQGMDILDTSSEPSFDRLAWLAQQLLDVPVAFISFVDADRSWQKAAIGTSTAEIPRSKSFCTHVVAAGEAVAVADARKDDRFQNNPFVTGSKNIPVMEQEQDEISVVSYAGAPITIDNDVSIGCVSVVDNEPREYSEKAMNSLMSLADEVGEKLDRRRQINEAKMEAKKAKKMKSEFLANMSHEIRTPLNSIMGMLQKLEETPLDQHQKEYVDISKQSSERLLKLITDILDVSKVEAGEIEIEHEPFQLEPIFMDVMSYFARKAHQKGLNLPCYIDLSCPATLIGDKDRIQQILINLISNALKFTESGEIRLRIFPEPESDEPGTIRFEVEDTGVGIPEEDREDLFERFSSSYLKKETSVKGTGLGLAICKQLVEQMNGEISVDSTKGEGSTFRFTIPFELPEEEGRTGEERLRKQIEHSGVSLSDKHVLVAHGSETMRSIIRTTLEEFGATVHEAEGGYHVLEEANRLTQGKQSIDVLVLDQQMDDIDGFEVVDELRGRIPSGKILMMLKTDNLNTNQERVSELGLGGYLIKPITQSMLIKSLLRMHGEKIDPEETEEEKHFELDWTQLESPPRLLIAEDNQHNRKLIEAILKQYPVRIDFADNGEKALRLAKSGLFDLIFMDIRMPEMDGLEVTERFRDWEEENEMDRTPVIALTAQALAENRQESLDAGCDEHLSKPIRENKLISTIQKFVSKQTDPGGSPAEVEEEDDDSTEVCPPDVSDSDLESQQTVVLDERFQEFVPDFLEDVHDKTEQIQDLWDRGDYAEIEDLAHDIKGAAGSFGFDQVQKAARTIETAAGEEEHQTIQTKTDRILKYLETVSVEYE